jgi:hypothetical protein
MVIRAHLYAENKINTMLDSFLPNPKPLARMRNFVLKLNLVRALGLVSDRTAGVVKILNDLRNRFAHNLSATVTDNDVASMLACLDPKSREITRKGGAEAAAMLRAVGQTQITDAKLRVCLIAIDARVLADLHTAIEMRRR